MPAPGVPVAPGDLIDGRYLVESLLGSGGMAVVHRARHTGTGAPCALKLVHPHLVPRRELVDLFLKEARAFGHIGKSPHVVEVLDAGFDLARGVPYLVMELLEGETLEDRTAREGPMPPPLLRAVFAQLGDALDQAHGAGVIHRDLKPSNLFLTPWRRGQPCLKVMDFGIAKVLEPSALHTATQIGTPAYAAPEQMGGAIREAAARQGIAVAAGVSPATDVWAVGLLAYELCTGLPAAQFWGAETTLEIPIRAVLFSHEAASARAGDRAALLPPGFDAWFARATCSDAGQRWPSAGVAVSELDRLFGGVPGPIHAHPCDPRTPGPESAGTPAPLSGYGPGATHVGLTPPPPLPSPIAWAGGTPSPPTPGSPPEPWAPPLVPSARVTRRAPRSPGPGAARVTGALLVAVFVAGAAIFVVPRVRARIARETCLASGDRCDEACDRGDAASCSRLAARCERGDGVPGDEERAAGLYARACDAADAAGCAGLGRLHRAGRGGLARDPARATQLFRKACEGGHARGCALLGESYRDGSGGLERDDARAVTLFQGACDRGDPVACKDLGGMHQYGRGGLARDEAEAAARYREACDGGEVLGCNDLGVLVGSGKGGLQQDERLAAELYQRACDGGEVLGCDNLAWMIEHGKGGLPADAVRAAALYEAACDRGDARGCGNLGGMVEQGKGLPADPARAAELYQRSCAGHAHACDSLGVMYEAGKGGLPRDEERAAELYRHACDAADMDGCNDLGHLRETGRGGLPRDDAGALALYQRACDGGVQRACVNQGVVLAAGRGGTRDESRAIALWQHACEAGASEGCAHLGWAYFLGHGALRDQARALVLLRRACEGGSARGCDRLHDAEGRALGPRSGPAPYPVKRP